MGGGGVGMGGGGVGTGGAGVGTGGNEGAEGGVAVGPPRPPLAGARGGGARLGEVPGSGRRGARLGSGPVLASASVHPPFTPRDSSPPGTSQGGPGGADGHAPLRPFVSPPWQEATAGPGLCWVGSGICVGREPL